MQYPSLAPRLLVIGAPSFVASLADSLVDPLVVLDLDEGDALAPLVPLASSLLGALLHAPTPRRRADPALALLAPLREAFPALPLLVVADAFDPALPARCLPHRAQCVFGPDPDALSHFASRARARRAALDARVDAVVASRTREHHLSPRESELLALVLRGARRDDLARATGVRENTLKTLIRRLLHKLDEPNLESAARTTLEELLRAHAPETLRWGEG